MHRYTRKTNCLISLLCVVLAVLVAFTGTGAIVTNHYLNKVNYDKGTFTTAATEKNLEQNESIDFDNVESSEKVDLQDGGNASSGESSNSNNSSGSSGSDVVLSGSIRKQANSGIEKNLSDKNIWYSDSVFNILIAGLDAGEKEATNFGTLPRSDSLMILSLNSASKKVKLVSLSRATYVSISGHGNKRLNAAHAYGGAALLVNTIERNYKVRIDKYITTNFSGFEKIIDALGGINITLTKAETKYVFWKTKAAGKYKLNGEEALRYARLRKIDSDRNRTARQRKIIVAIKNKMFNMSFGEADSLFDSILPLVTTSFSKSQLLSKISKAYTTYQSWPMTQDIVPHDATKLTMKDGKEVLILDWSSTTSYLHKILYSGTTPKSYEM